MFHYVCTRKLECVIWSVLLRRIALGEELTRMSSFALYKRAKMDASISELAPSLQTGAPTKPRSGLRSLSLSPNSLDLAPVRPIGACVAIRSTPVFTTATLPDALRRAHRLRPNIWGVIRVLEGSVLFHIKPEIDAPQILTPIRPGIISPGQIHRVEPLGRVSLRIDFYDRDPCAEG